MRKLILVILTTVWASSGMTETAFGFDDQTIVFYRSGGFRRVADPNDENDYAFEAKPNGNWSLSLHRSGRKYYGTLTMKQRAELDKLVASIQKADESDLADPRIADLPSFGFFNGTDEKSRIKLKIDAGPARKAHQWLIQLRELSNPNQIAHLQFFGSSPQVSEEMGEVLESIEAVKKMVGKEAAEKLKPVNFGKQKVVLFQWSGSGQDRLETRLIEKNMASELEVKRIRGRSRDLRSHTHVFVMPKNQAFRSGK